MASFSDTVTNIDKVSIYGRNKVDYLAVDAPENISDTDKYKRDVVLATGIFDKVYKPVWNETGNRTLEKPLIIVDFDDQTINSNSMSSVEQGMEVLGYVIFRKEYRYDDYGKLVEVEQVKLTEAISGSASGARDYSIKNNCFYQWILYPKFKSGTTDKLGGMASTLFSGDYIMKSRAQFESWSVIFLNDDDGEYSIYSEPFVFRCNLQAGSLTQNMDKTQFETYSKYPKISVGEKNYISGSLSCLLSDVSYRDGETETQKATRDKFGYNNVFYNEDIYKWNRWCDYIASGKPCLIKDPKGHMFIANIVSNSGTKFMNTIDPPTTISFSFVEIDSIADIAIAKEII